MRDVAHEPAKAATVGAIATATFAAGAAGDAAQVGAARDGGVPAVRIAAMREKAMLRLRSWAPRPPESDRVVIAGQSLPAEVGTTLPGPTRALCLGPSEWLIISQDLDATALRSRVEADLVPQGLVLVDLTDGLASFEVQGAAACDVLSKGCGLDFHPRTFLPQQCARTRFAQLAVVIESLDGPSRFELHVGRSYAAFVQSWLLDAAVEFDS